MYGWAYRRVLFPTWQRAVRGRSIGAQIALLETTQWLSPEEIEAFQMAELRVLLDHARQNVPYWRDLFGSMRFDPRSVRSRADLAQLPVLTREIVRERFDDLVAPGARARNIRKGTSGTTGAPLKFEYCSESESWRQAVRLRGYGWAGYEQGRPTLHYWGAGTNVPRGLAAAKVRLDRALRREVYVDAVKQDEAAMWRTASRIARMRPRVIVAYTQALAAFARWAVEHEARDWPDVRIVCAAEALWPRDREALVSAFGPHVFETYGSRETMLVSAECGAHDGMHLSEENLAVEVVRDRRQVGAGETGDVLVTDLHNRGMPFIRYANGDVATMSHGARCSCGRGLRKIARVEGRRADTLRDADGHPVPGMLFVSLLQPEVEILRAFQVVQKRSGEVELKVVRGRDWDERRFQDITRRAAAYFKGLPLNVVYCDAIPASASGKRRPIVVEA